MTTSSNSVLTFTEEFSIRSFDVDCAGRLRPTALFNYFQDIAGRHADALGLGYKALQSSGNLWVLSRALVRITRLPRWEESVQLTTWPKGVDGLLFLREFSLTDQTGATLVLGTTGWLFLDAQSFKPLGAQSLPIPLPVMPQKHALDEPLKKLKVPAALPESHARKVLQSDIDVNKHVNNARYVDWVMDMYDVDFHAGHSLRSLQMNYLGEAHPNDVITLRSGNVGSSPQTDFVEGTREGEGGRIVQALVEWE
jgi:medium-chain acyl-[acyl-carrier-protein] hydrolase